MFSNTIVSSPFYFFYGHDPKKVGDSAIFSNWYPATFQDDYGNLFHNSEQYMMWRKAVLFNDAEMASKILEVKNGDPKICKALGRTVKNFNQDIWNTHAKKIVKDGCYYKFTQNKDLKTKLLATKGKQLVEASPFDKIWGIGMSSNNPNATFPSKWKGTNWLGICLDDVRDRIALEIDLTNTIFTKK
jgi:ribA/ribD-fused uncharacterized protein